MGRIKKCANIIKELTEENPWFEIGASSVIGGRNYQQDFGYIYGDSRKAVAVVCDGMGGLEGGERASRTAVEVFAKDLQEEKPDANIPGFLMREAERMDREVADLKDGEGKPLKSGTTMVAVCCKGSQMDWISVGDSKIYLIRGETITALNIEHNYRQMLKEQLEAGQITQEFYQREEKTRQAEALTSFIGMDRINLIDWGKTPCKLEDGDIVMLCSDGVYKSIDHYQILGMIRDNDLDMEIAADRLTAMALRYGGKRQDNTTVILMRYRQF